MRHQRRIRALGLLAAALVVALVLGREAVESWREADGVSADAESARGSARGEKSTRSTARAKARADADSTRPVGDSADAVSAGEAVAGFEPEQSASDDSDESLRHGDGVQAIELDPIGKNRSLAPIRLAGRDPLAPRDLLAWRMKNGRFAIVARGSSEPNGSLDFPEIIAPIDGMEIVVTSADSVPGLPGASEPQRLAARDPQPPQATVVAADAERTTLRIFPGEATGYVLLADSYGVVFASYPVPESPLSAHRVIDVGLSVGGSDAVVLLAHEFSDGRASEWNVLKLPTPEADEAPAN